MIGSARGRSVSPIASAKPAKTESLDTKENISAFKNEDFPVAPKEEFPVAKEKFPVVPNEEFKSSAPVDEPLIATYT